MRPTGWIEEWQGTLGGQGVHLFNGYNVVKPGNPMPTTQQFMWAGGLRIPRGDNIKTSASAEHQQVGKLHRYELTIDTREVQTIRLGDFVDYAFHEGDLTKPAKTEQPEGWIGTGFGWFVNVEDKPVARSKDSKFVVESHWLPGPVSVMLQGEPPGMLPDRGSVLNQHVAEAVSITRNSVRRTVIGPAIPPDATDGDLRTLLKNWVRNQNLGFLQPMAAEGSDLKAELAKIKPKTELEQQIVDCLQEVVR
jgi:hypothetical protein